MADLRTWEQIERERLATAGWQSQRSVALAKRRMDAIFAALQFPDKTDERGQRLEFNHDSWWRELNLLMSFVRDNDTQSAAEKLSNPSVLHADFSTFGQYGGG